MEDFGDFFKIGIPSIVLNLSLIVTLVVSMFCYFSPFVKYKKLCVLIPIFVEYLFVVVCSTIICRGQQSFEFAKLELEPFWTYKAVIQKVSGVSVWDIILNVVLFIPLGLLIKLIDSAFSFGKILIVSICCSLFIETNQYIFEKGITQMDDVIHNTLVGAIGWTLSYGILCLYLRKRTR